MDISGLVKAVMEEIRDTVKSETVFGTAVHSRDSVIIPVSRVSFGFGVGAGGRDAKKLRSGEGAGGGAVIEPVACVVVTGGKARVFPLRGRQTVCIRLVDIIPKILDIVLGAVNRKKKGNEGHTR